jgi:hypothetical protein
MVLCVVLPWLCLGCKHVDGQVRACRMLLLCDGVHAGQVVCVGSATHWLRHWSAAGVPKFASSGVMQNVDINADAKALLSTDEVDAG